jgi:hypothetical protein
LPRSQQAAWRKAAAGCRSPGTSSGIPPKCAFVFGRVPKVRVPESCGTVRGWRIAEAEAALAGFPVIEPAYFRIGVGKAVGFRQKTSRHKRRGRRIYGRWRWGLLELCRFEMKKSSADVRLA